MAVLECLPGIEATILVEGEALTEYAAENDIIIHKNPATAAWQQTRTVTKYIESTTGKTFSLKVNVKAPYKIDCPKVSFSLYVDGQWIHGPLMTKGLYKTGNWSIISEGPTEKLQSGAQVALMKFAEIQSTDENTESSVLKEDKKVTDRVGEIMIKVHRRSVGKVIESKNKPTFEGLEHSKKYHDKLLAKDGKSHGVALGDTKEVAWSTRWEADYLDGEDFPLLIFRFKYRSAHALQNLHVLPRADSAGTVDQEATVDSEEDELDDLDPEIRERVKRILARAKGKIKSETKIKRDYSDDEEDVKPVKKVRSNKKRMTGKTTIDLTEDDDVEAQIVSLE
ncbi:hypothetical protein IFR05_014229 [Cadophora sp. M221]|nr:hypothetical protein IFR05_014229 [Cadophora sp. M221]